MNILGLISQLIGIETLRLTLDITVKLLSTILIPIDYEIKFNHNHKYNNAQILKDTVMLKNYSRNQSQTQ